MSEYKEWGVVHGNKEKGKIMELTAREHLLLFEAVRFVDADKHHGLRDVVLKKAGVVSADLDNLLTKTAMGVLANEKDLSTAPQIQELKDVKL